MSDNEIRSSEPFAQENSQAEKTESPIENGHHQTPPSIADINEPINAYPPVEPPFAEVRFTEWTNVDGRTTNPIGATPQPAEPMNQPSPFGQPPYGENQGYTPNFAPPFNQQAYPNANPYAPVSNSSDEPLPVRKNKATMWIAIGVIALLLF